MTSISVHRVTDIKVGKDSLEEHHWYTITSVYEGGKEITFYLHTDGDVDLNFIPTLGVIE